MTRSIRLRSLALVFVQVVVALALFVYQPYEYKSSIGRLQAAQPDHKIRVEMGYFEKHWPPPSGIVLDAINFPARIVSGIPFHWNWIEQADVYRGGWVWLDRRELAFLVGVPLFWFWIAAELQSRALQPKRGSAGVLLRSIVGLVVGGLCGWSGIDLLLDYSHRAYRVVGGFGVAWAFVLLTYFGSMMFNVSRTRTATAPPSSQMQDC